MSNLANRVIAAINRVDTQDKYNNLKLSFEHSDAEETIKDEAIRYLKTSKPQFDKEEKPLREDVLLMIKESEAEIPKLD